MGLGPESESRTSGSGVGSGGVRGREGERQEKEGARPQKGEEWCMRGEWGTECPGETEWPESLWGRGVPGASQSVGLQLLPASLFPAFSPIPGAFQDSGKAVRLGEITWEA